jgi:hypothetical protein
MTKVCHLAQWRREIESSTRTTHFTRSELNQLLSLYSRRVARGEWRDYAIDQRPGTAAFSIFRHTHERPLYTITKRLAGPGQAVEYLVFRDYRRLTRTPRLDEALGAIERPLKVVS